MPALSVPQPGQPVRGLGDNYVRGDGLEAQAAFERLKLAIGPRPPYSALLFREARQPEVVEEAEWVFTVETDWSITVTRKLEFSRLVPGLGMFVSASGDKATLVGSMRDLVGLSRQRDVYLLLRMCIECPRVEDIWPLVTTSEESHLTKVSRGSWSTPPTGQVAAIDTLKTATPQALAFEYIYALQMLTAIHHESDIFVKVDARDLTTQVPFARLLTFLNNEAGHGQPISELAGLLNGTLGNFPSHFRDMDSSWNYLIDPNSSLMAASWIQSPRSAYLRMLARDINSATFDATTGSTYLPIQLLIPIQSIMARFADNSRFSSFPVSLPLTISANAFRFYGVGAKIARQITPDTAVSMGVNEARYLANTNDYYSAILVPTTEKLFTPRGTSIQTGDVMEDVALSTFYQACVGGLFPSSLNSRWQSSTSSASIASIRAEWLPIVARVWQETPDLRPRLAFATARNCPGSSTNPTMSYVISSNALSGVSMSERVREAMRLDESVGKSGLVQAFSVDAVPLRWAANLTTEVEVPRVLRRECLATLLVDTGRLASLRNFDTVPWIYMPLSATRVANTTETDQRVATDLAIASESSSAASISAIPNMVHRTSASLAIPTYQSANPLITNSDYNRVGALALTFTANFLAPHVRDHIFANLVSIPDPVSRSGGLARPIKQALSMDGIDAFASSKLCVTRKDGFVRVFNPSKPNLAGTGMSTVWRMPSIEPGPVASKWAPFSSVYLNLVTSYVRGDNGPNVTSYKMHGLTDTVDAARYSSISISERAKNFLVQSGIVGSADAGDPVTRLDRPRMKVLSAHPVNVDRPIMTADVALKASAGFSCNAIQPVQEWMKRSYFNVSVPGYFSRDLSQFPSRGVMDLVFTARANAAPPAISSGNGTLPSTYDLTLVVVSWGRCPIRFTSAGGVIPPFEYLNARETSVVG